MKSQKEIFSWLKANLGKTATAPLTSTDVFALVTSVSLSNLISYRSAPPELFEAYGSIVKQMQPHTRHLAFHAIAMELDWSHREMIWDAAGLGEFPTSVCSFSPEGRNTLQAVG